MKKKAIIVAGGMGTRMGTAIPKQFLLIKEKPVLYYTISTFLEAYEDIEITLVLPKSHFAEGEKIIQTYFSTASIALVEGGDTRYQSVKNGLKNTTSSSIVFVHDAVRCTLSSDLVKRCFDAAVINGIAIPATAVKDSMRIKTKEGYQPIDRDQLLIMQTPQTVKAELLLKAFELPYQSHFTDEASVLESAGFTLYYVEGESNNIKITTPDDLSMATALLS